jgi:hypothetical protein
MGTKKDVASQLGLKGCALLTHLLRVSETLGPRHEHKPERQYHGVAYRVIGAIKDRQYNVDEL